MGEALIEFSCGTGPGPPEGVLARALGTDSSPDPTEPARSRSRRLPELGRRERSPPPKIVLARAAQKTMAPVTLTHLAHVPAFVPPKARLPNSTRPADCQGLPELDGAVAAANELPRRNPVAVSYTHLTLPTKA